MAPSERFLTIVKRHLRYLPEGAALGDDVALRPLGLDSLARIDLVLDLEEAFDIDIADEDLMYETFETAHTLWSVVNARTARETRTARS